MKRKLYARLNARRVATALATAAMLAALGLTGCVPQTADAEDLPLVADDAAQAAGAEETVESEEAGAMLSDAVEGSSVNAIVKSVDGNEITVMILEEPPGQPGEAPEKASNDQQEGNQSSDSMGEPPAMPEGGAPAGEAGEPPAKPDGEAPDGQAGEPPAMPNGEAPANGAGEPPAKPVGEAPDGGMPGGVETVLTVVDESAIVVDENGEQTTGSLADVEEGSMLALTVADDGISVMRIVVADGMMQAGPGGQGGPGAGSAEPNSGTGATTFSEDAAETGAAYESAESDVSAIMADNGATVKLSNATVTKTGDSSNSGDSDFYGLNAGVVATDAANVTIEGGSVTTDAQGANGVFAYGEGTEVTVSDLQIATSQSNSGGIEVAGGATLTATNLDVDTQGQSSAAIRSDRGGGTETVAGGSYTTHGTGSPAIYCTADVTVSDATLLAENSEGIVIEGFNSVTLENDDVTGNVNGNAIRTGVVPNVMIYQSMSGDAAEGTGTFTMRGGSFTADNGTLFYVTNTSASIDITDVDLRIADDLLIVAGNDGQWGKEGSNGGAAVFTATDQVLTGNVTVDESSSAVLNLAGSTSYEGAVNATGQAGEVTVDIAEGATWTLSDDSYITDVTGDTAGIDLNGHTLYVNGEAWSA